MTITDILKRDEKFKYMLLARCKSDCDSMSHLWGITKDYHVKTMVTLWHSLKIKPEWLTKKELNDISISLIGKEI